MGLVDSGAGMHFGPVKKAIERLLVFSAKPTAMGSTFHVRIPGHD
jgi:hypothetical protein